MKKKRVVIGAVVAIVAAVIGWFFWPLSIPVPAGEGVVSLGFHRTYLGEGTPKVEQWMEEYEPGTEEYAAVQAVLAQYSCHRNFHTVISYFQSAVGWRGTQKSMTVCNVAGDNSVSMMHIVDVGEIMIDGVCYQVGWFGNDASVRLIEELVAIAGR